MYNAAIAGTTSPYMSACRCPHVGRDTNSWAGQQGGDGRGWKSWLGPALMVPRYCTLLVVMSCTPYVCAAQVLTTT
jgi:hypothetical protein